MSAARSTPPLRPPSGGLVGFSGGCRREGSADLQWGDRANDSVSWGDAAAAQLQEVL